MPNKGYDWDDALKEREQVLGYMMLVCRGLLLDGAGAAGSLPFTLKAKSAPSDRVIEVALAVHANKTGRKPALGQTRCLPLCMIFCVCVKARQLSRVSAFSRDCGGQLSVSSVLI